MRTRIVLIGVGGVLVIAVAVLIALTSVVGLDPAFSVAVDFVEGAGTAAGASADARVMPTLGDALQNYVENNCPDASVAACVEAYTPPEWGDMLSAVFRRAVPDGDDAWDVLVIATYEAAQGFSGVCVYARVERLASPDGDAYNGWRVARWSGFISCDEPNAGLSALASDDAPNKAP
jgi:hypothetical protein